MGKFVAEFLKNDATLEVSNWRKVRYSSREKALAELKTHLAAYRSTLGLALCSAILYVPQVANFTVMRC
jgi:hypothetical protein